MVDSLATNPAQKPARGCEPTVTSLTYKAIGPSADSKGLKSSCVRNRGLRPMVIAKRLPVPLSEEITMV